MMIVLEYTILIDKFSVSQILLKIKKKLFQKAHIFCKYVERIKESNVSKITEGCTFTRSKFLINHFIKVICCFQYKYLKPF